MKTSLLGILVAGSAVGWVAMACGDRETSSSLNPGEAASKAGAGGAPIAGAAGAASMGATAGNGPVGTRSGLDPEKQVNQLTVPEIGQLCEAIAPPALVVATDPDKFRGSCVARIIQSQVNHTLTTLEQCQQALVQCDAAAAPTSTTRTDVPLPSVLAAGLSCVGTTPIVNPTCRANVGELEGCQTAGLGTLAVANQATCDTILSGQAARQVAQSLGDSGVLACQGYQRKCPDGFASGGGGASGTGGASAVAGVASVAGAAGAGA